MKKIKKILSGYQMTPQEREQVWHGIVQKTKLRVATNKKHYVMRFAMVSLVVGMLVVTPFAYAAEQSLPGDMTYPIKTKVLEPIKERLLVKEAARAAYQKQLLEKRTEELQRLEDNKETTKDRLEKAREALHKQEEKIEKKIEVLESRGEDDAVEMLREVQKKQIEIKKEIIEKLEEREIKLKNREEKILEREKEFNQKREEHLREQRKKQEEQDRENKKIEHGE